MMKILAPNKKLSKKLIPKELSKEFNSRLVKEIGEMEEMMAVNQFMNGRHGFAIAHCQISEDPYRIFVAKAELLPQSVVINPFIVEKSEPYMVKELCLSFPFRPEKKVKRYYKIEVEYRDRFFNMFVEKFEGFQAQIFQHEIQHFNGENIYD